MKDHKHIWKRITVTRWECTICEVKGKLHFIGKWKKMKIQPILTKGKL